MNSRLKALLVFGVGIIGILVWYVTKPAESNQVASDKIVPAPQEAATHTERSTPAMAVGTEDQVANSRQRKVQLEHDLVAIGRKSVPEAVAFIQQNYPEQGRQRALGFLMEELAKERFDAIKEIAPLITSAVELEGALGTIAYYWSRKSPEDSLRFAESLPTELKVTMMDKLVHEFTRDGRVDEATTVLAKMPYSARRSDAIGKILDGFARTNPEAAVTWASALPLPEDIKVAHRRLAAVFSAKGNIDALQHLLNKTTDAEVRRGILSKLGNLAGERRGAAGALQAAEGVSAVDRERLIGGAISSVPVADLPKLAGEIPNMTDAFARARATGAYVDRLFALGEAQAVQWVQNTPPKMREYAISHLVSKWYSTDSMALSGWVNTLPKGEDRDTALAALSRRLKNDDRNAAAEFAAQISDDRRRSGIQAELGVGRK